MDGKMKVAVMNGIGEMGFVEREIPKPAADEVLVKLEYVGICGSDMHYYETGAIGDYVVEPPFVAGWCRSRSWRKCKTFSSWRQSGIGAWKNMRSL